MNEHLKIEINEKCNFKVVTCTEGHYITDWDKKDILTFTSAKKMYCPMNYNLDNFYCITQEEYNLLNEQKRVKEEEERTKKEEANNPYNKL
jgi:hypothetical protein